nr:putative reverse transcriptase domain-containing protein [Tanacetum cinerariifolium]
MDPLNPPPPASKSKPEDAIEVENPIKHEDEIFPTSVHEVSESSTALLFCEDIDGLLPGLMRRDINSLFGADEFSFKTTENVDAAIATERARHVNVGNDARGSRPVRGQDAVPTAHECTFAGFIKCNPTTFHGTKGVVGLLRWFEKTESVFRISECAEGKKRFNELPLMCPRMVEPKRVKVDAYIRGLTDNIKGEVTSSRLANLNEAVRMAHKLMDQKAQARNEKILEGKKRKWESFENGNSSGKGNQRDNSRQTL